MTKSKKHEQLGMNPSTASGRLVKDLLFKFLIDAGHVCHQCKGELLRDDFSIEHIEHWLDAKAPQEKYFDLDNIAFSHLSCNIKASRAGSGFKKPNARKAPHGAIRCYQNGCRCSECIKARSKYYIKTGH